MPVVTHYVRISNIVVSGGSGTALNLGDIATNASTAASAISATIAPSAGAAANLIDNNPATEATWAAAGGRPVLTLTLGGLISTITQTSGTTVAGQIISATVEDSTDNATWTTIGTGPWNTAATANTAAAATVLTVQKVENPVDSAAFAEVYTDNLQYSTDMISTLPEVLGSQTVANYPPIAETPAATDAPLIGVGVADSEAASFTDAITSLAYTFYADTIGLADAVSVMASTTGGLSDSAALTDVIQQAIIQLISDAASGSETLSLSAALTMVDIANAIATPTSTYNSVMLVAEIIAAVEFYNSAPSYDIVDAGVLTDAYAALSKTLAALLDSAQAIDTDTAVIRVLQTSGDTITGTASFVPAGSVLSALLGDGVLATIRLNIGGEVFTGWVLNTDTLAPSEYQFANLSFNSACKWQGIYLLAADDGIYQFTEDVGVESMVTYVKTGKTDFGSDQQKRITDAYISYSASGAMTLKITSTEHGQIVIRNYTMTPPSPDQGTDNVRFDVGKGARSRYWQFELLGSGVDCDIDEIGMLPVILSRRI